jgi:hypothetical protein
MSDQSIVCGAHDNMNAPVQDNSAADVIASLQAQVAALQAQLAAAQAQAPQTQVEPNA